MRPQEKQSSCTAAEILGNTYMHISRLTANGDFDTRKKNGENGKFLDRLKYDFASKKDEYTSQKNR